MTPALPPMLESQPEGTVVRGRLVGPEPTASTAHGVRWRDCGPHEVHTHGTRLARVESIDVDSQGLPWLIPGLVDLQVNGHGGVTFADPALTEDDVVACTRALWRHGTTSYLPTIVTCEPDVLERNVAVIAAARRADPWIGAPP